MSAKYRIDIINDFGEEERFEVPLDAVVLDYGYSLSVELPCRCSCGDQHRRTLAHWPKSQVAEAWVTDHVLSMAIKSRALEPSHD